MSRSGIVWGVLEVSSKFRIRRALLLCLRRPMWTIPLEIAWPSQSTTHTARMSCWRRAACMEASGASSMCPQMRFTGRAATARMQVCWHSLLPICMGSRVSAPSLYLAPLPLRGRSAVHVWDTCLQTRLVCHKRLHVSGVGEDSTLEPTNPYSAAKAGAEMIAKAYLTSYKLPVITTRGNNVYGPNQFPEKSIPKFTLLAARGEELPVHGDGTHSAFLLV